MRYFINEYKTEFKMSDKLWFNAVDKNDINLIKKYLAYGFNINCLDKYNKTALIIASMYFKLEVVKELLKYPNIDINLKDWIGFSAIMYASREGMLEIVIELLKHPNIDINIQEEHGLNVLMLACHNHNLQIVKELLKHSININHQDSYNTTALMIAVGVEDENIIKELLKHPNIDVNLKSKNNQTALDLAKLQHSSLKIKKLLRDAGATE